MEYIVKLLMLKFPKPLPHLLVVLLMIAPLPISKAQERGSLHGIVVERVTARPQQAIVELYSKTDSQCKYSGVASEAGQFRVENLPIGSYTLYIKPPMLMAESLNIVISAGVDRDLGYIRVGPEDCSEPGMICHPWWPIDGARKLDLPCIENVTILRNDNDLPVIIESEELHRRALVRPSPEWPPNTPKGYSVGIYLAIGRTGEVLCAVPFGKGEPENAVLKAVRRWHFQPVLDKGKPIVTTGILEFDYP